MAGSARAKRRFGTTGSLSQRPEPVQARPDGEPVPCPRIVPIDSRKVRSLLENASEVFGKGKMSRRKSFGRIFRKGPCLGGDCSEGFDQGSSSRRISLRGIRGRPSTLPKIVPNNPRKALDPPEVVLDNPQRGIQSHRGVSQIPEARHPAPSKGIPNTPDRDIWPQLGVSWIPCARHFVPPQVVSDTPPPSFGVFASLRFKKKTRRAVSRRRLASRNRRERTCALACARPSTDISCDYCHVPK